MWHVELELIADWLRRLDRKSKVLVLAAFEILEERGPNLRRPLVGKIAGAKLVPSMKELRPGLAGRSEIRILFCFDPGRNAVMLIGGDKRGRWDAWYKQVIPVAESRYVRWLEKHYQ